MQRVAVFLAFLLLASACSDDPSDVDAGPSDEGTTSTTTSKTAEPTSTTAAPTLAIALCDDLTRPAPIIGSLPGGTNLPDRLTTAARAYLDEHEDVSAGLRIDRDYGGTLVLAVTDDPAPHLARLQDRSPFAETEFVYDVVQVDFTSGELDQLQAEAVQLMGRGEGPQIVGMGAGNIHNRVTLNIIRPTAEHLATIAAEFPDRADMFCLEGGLWDESMAPPSVDEPLTVMADAGDDPLVTCSGSGPFRLSALDGEPDVAADTTDPAERTLLDSGHVESGAGEFPQEGWRTLIRTEKRASFYWFGNSHFLLHDLENTPGGWTLRGTSGGDDCRLRLHLGNGVDIMQIGLDPENPVDPASTTLHLLVSQSACSGGASGVESMRPPEVIETDTEIRLAIAVVPPEGMQTCPGNASAPITIELDAPIGDRAILDGIRIPAEPIEESLLF